MLSQVAEIVYFKRSGDVTAGEELKLKNVELDKESRRDQERARN